MFRHAAIGLLLLAIGFAGCADEGDPEVKGSGVPTGSAAAPTVSTDTGSITGLIVDDQSAPVPGARVGIPQLDLDFAVSDNAGAFTLNNVPPGTHSLFAEQLGYESKAQKVTVVAGEVATVRFVLTPIATPGLARQLSYVADGFVELAVVVPAVGVFYFNNTGENLNVVSYQVANDAATAVIGLKWDSSAPLTGRFSRVNTVACKISSCDPQAPNNFTRGFSPVLLRNENLQEIIKNRPGFYVQTQWYPTTCQAISNEFCLQHPDTITAITAQQRYKLYTTVFFAEPAPAGFSPLPS